MLKKTNVRQQKKHKICISFNEDEFEALRALKEKEQKSYQFLIFMALEKQGYFKNKKFLSEVN
ncbi:MAG: hypothetical protein AB7D43_13110 [Sulfurimonadaceae bacterium]